MKVNVPLLYTYIYVSSALAGPFTTRSSEDSKRCETKNLPVIEDIYDVRIAPKNTRVFDLCRHMNAPLNP